jgi:hypothetical protein
MSARARMRDARGSRFILRKVNLRGDRRAAEKIWRGIDGSNPSLPSGESSTNGSGELRPSAAADGENPEGEPGRLGRGSDGPGRGRRGDRAVEVPVAEICSSRWPRTISMLSRAASSVKPAEMRLGLLRAARLSASRGSPAGPAARAPRSGGPASGRRRGYNWPG